MAKENWLERTVELDVRQVNKEKREADVSFSSETDKVKRWFGTEILSHKKGAVDFSRLKVGAHLFNHNPDRIIGPIVNATVNDGRGEAVIGYDPTEEGELALIRTMNKSLRGTSVRYIPLKIRELAEGEVWQGAQNKVKREEGGESIIVITRWAPVEISSTPTPADPDVGIGREMGLRSLEGIETENEILTINQEDNDMEESRVKQLIKEAVEGLPNAEDLAKVVREAITEETKPKMRVTPDEYTDLLARAGALGEEAVAKFAGWVAEGRGAQEIQGELLTIATGKTNAKHIIPAPEGTDGKKCSDVPDEDFASMIQRGNVIPIF